MQKTFAVVAAEEAEFRIELAFGAVEVAKQRVCDDFVVELRPFVVDNDDVEEEQRTFDDLVAQLLRLFVVGDVADVGFEELAMHDEVVGYFYYIKLN